MKNIIMWIVIPCILIMQSYGQRHMNIPDRPVMPRFSFDAVSFMGDEKGRERLDLMIEIPFESLQFVREGDKFVARFDITVNINDSNETSVNESFWKKTIETTEYEKTVSSLICYVDQRTFFLPPGIYNVSVNIKDMETENPYLQKKKIKIRRFFNSSFAVSDIMFVSRVEMDSDGTIISPNISASFGGGRDSFYVFFEIYDTLTSDSATLSISVRNMKGAIVQSDSFGLWINGPIQPGYKKITTDSLIAGDYILELKCLPVRNQIVEKFSEEQINVSRTFMLRWKGMPVSISDLDQAIEQLQYIAYREQLEEMRNASMELKRQLFQKFWRERDPTPQTERNELMEEYYSRVTYANMNFKHYLDGWRTDMGMIYILFGAPSNIDRHPFEMNTRPYEIWSYYELNKEFIFVDMTGFGDYKLQNADLDIDRMRQRY